MPCGTGSDAAAGPISPESSAARAEPPAAAPPAVARPPDAVAAPPADGIGSAGLAALGIKTGFIGQVADDQLGKIYQHDIEAKGIDFLVPARADVGATARCLILVTPDAQRTMNTFLGAAQMLEAKDVDLGVVASAGITYLEGYLWDPAEPRAAMREAIRVARDSGGRVAFTLSDAFVIDRHGEDFGRLIHDGQIDILFANDVEVRALMKEDDIGVAVRALADGRRVPRGRPGRAGDAGTRRSPAAAPCLGGGSGHAGRRARRRGARRPR